jgi:hypothetical protein
VDTENSNNGSKGEGTRVDTNGQIKWRKSGRLGVYSVGQRSANHWRAKKSKREKMEEKGTLIDNKQVSVKTIDSRARHPRFSISFSLLLPNIMGTCRKCTKGINHWREAIKY